MDLLCQEMRMRAGIASARKVLLRNRHSNRAFLSPWTRDVVREIKGKKEGGGALDEQCVKPGLQPGNSFEHFVPSSERGHSFIPLCASLLKMYIYIYISEGRMEAVPPFECGKATVEGRCPDFGVCTWEGDTEFVSVPAFLCWLVGLALVTVVCFFLSHEPPTHSPER